MSGVLEAVALEPGWLQPSGHFPMRKLRLSWSVLKVTLQGHTAGVVGARAGIPGSKTPEPALFPGTRNSCKP